MDPLTELFASKPTSYLGTGIIYNGDTRGNGVSSTEQDVVVIPRFNQSDSAVSDHPFRIAPSGVISPGTVNGLFPTLGGESIDDTDNVVDMDDAVVWLQITWSVTWSDSTPEYLASATLSAVSILSGASLPADSATVKRFQLATIASGVATMTVQNNITAFLLDNGPDATALGTLAAP
jgi:hypothetical protein